MNTNLSPQDQEFYEKALAAYRKKNYAYAVELLQEILKNNPYSASALRYLWLSLREQKSSAPDNLARTIINSAVIAGLSLRLVIIQPLQKHHQSEDILKKIIFRDPRNISALQKLAGIYILQDRKEAAIMTLEEIIALDQNNIPALQKLAETYFQDHNHQKAKRIAEKLLQIAPRNLSAENILKDISAFGTIEKGFNDIKPAT